MIKQILINRIVFEAFNWLKISIKNSDSALGLSNKIKLIETDIPIAIQNHMKFVVNYSGSLSIRDDIDNRTITSSYIDLDVRLTPKKWTYRELTDFDVMTLFDLFDFKEHLVILGGPGAGKSTSVKKICDELINYENVIFKNFNFPILIRLRDKDSQNGIMSSLQRILPIGISMTKNEDIDGLVKKFIRDLLIGFYDELGIVLLLDGFDELPYDRRDSIMDEIELFANNFNKSKIILTSRSSAFDANLNNCKVFELCDLSEEQKNEFVDKWFNNNKIAKKFKSQAKGKSFYDTLAKPLNLAYLCAIFRKYNNIPDQPKLVYKKIIRLLLEEWDEQNRVKRDSRYTNLQIESKQEFLGNLAYHLSTNFKEKIYSEEQIRFVYREIFTKFGLSRNEMKKVLSELETHTGLFIKSSYDTYEFDHKSLQEFLAAEYIVSLGYIPSKSELANELAIATGLAYEPDHFLARLVFQYASSNLLSIKFAEEYLSRLIDENVNFQRSPLVSLGVFLIYSKCYIKIFKGNHLFTKLEDYTKDEYEIGRIFAILNSKTFFTQSIEALKVFFTIAETNSNGVVIIRPMAKRRVELFKKFSFLGNYKDLLTEGIKVNENYIS